MTTAEFSSEFDILYNNIMSNQAPGLDDYEKSVLLTQAQEAVVTEIYKGTFEGSEDMTEYIQVLVKQRTSNPADVSDTTVQQGNQSSNIDNPQDINTIRIVIPNDLWYIVYESALISMPECSSLKRKDVPVIPVTHDHYTRIKENPFKKPNNHRVLRIIADNIIELKSAYKVEKYLLRYIRKPVPIIIPQTVDTSINGETTQSECELAPAIHRTILIRAVELAKNIWKG